MLGEKSDLTRFIGECLTKGSIFRREQVEHEAPGGESRLLGVTISPIRRGTEKINGAICLMTDLTELAALQQQIQLKESLAAVGELSAGIAHEFKNALATISGYAQMISAEAVTGEVADSAERILEQTRNITHVVTEFLKYARPLGDYQRTRRARGPRRASRVRGSRGDAAGAYSVRGAFWKRRRG